MSAADGLAEQAAATAARAVTAFGLDSAWRWPDRPLDDEAWGSLLRAAISHRLVGLLAAAVRAGALPTSPRQRDDLAGLAEQWMTSDLVLERFALDVHDVLRRHEIDHRFLKGVALAHTSYDRPDERVFGDVDLAVPSGAVESTFAVLAESVGPRMEPELRRGFDLEFGKGATFKSPSGREVDVHRTLVWGALGLTVMTDDLFADGTPFALGGRTLVGLGRVASFIHACYSAVLGDVPPRLVSLRDVAQTLPASEQSDDVIEMAHRWRAALVVATAIARMRATLQVAIEHPLLEWAVGYEPTVAERALLRAHLMPGGTYARRVAAVAVIPGLGAQFRYVRASAWPSKEYLASRRFTWSTHVKRSLRFADPRRPLRS